MKSVDLKKINPKKILVINTFGIGDVLFTTPFISNLKANFPECTIGYLGNRRTAPLLENNPHIDKIYVYERDEFYSTYKESKLKFFKKVKGCLDDIKKDKYEAVFDFSLNATINFLTMCAGIKHRIGFNFKNRSPYLTVKFPFEGFERKHVAQYYLDMLEPLGLAVYNKELEMVISEEDQKWASRFLTEAGYKNGQTLVGVIPGAGESWGKQARFRRWSVDKYAQLVDKLIENSSLKIILLGTKQEEDLCKRIQTVGGEGLIEAYGKTTIGQFAALLEKCHLVVLNDGGPLHVAVAAKTRTVSIFGPVDENVYGPFGSKEDHLVVKKNLLCQPCYRRFRMTNCNHVSCLEDLSVDEVFAKVSRCL